METIKKFPKINKKDFPLIDKKDFPLLEGFSNKNTLIYLDHAATTQKPIQVLQKIDEYYRNFNANVHRGAHQLSAKATEEFEHSRSLIAKYLNAYSSKEIIFTRNATEAINLAARSWGEFTLRENDEILISIMEHHSNIVPWQMVAAKNKCKLKYVGIDNNGRLDLNDFKSKLSKKTKLVSLLHISNTLGCCNPIKEITKLAKQNDSLVMLDACQSLAHKKLDVQELGIDFLAGSGHKLCGPTGIGFLWSKKEILEEIPPFFGGGEMIQDVFEETSTWAELPHKFEAGTPAIAEAIGLAEAIKYINNIGLDQISEYEKQITKYLFEQIGQIEDLKIIGPSPKIDANRASLATFYVRGIHSNDIAEILDSKGICIRSGHHCCQPLHRHIGVNATARVSMNFTTSLDDINTFIEKLRETISFLKLNS
tara:strand:+ start:1129 stop:2403 length:1275 start_codon:yes stop_codon:yes gene_type:complete